MTIRRRLPCLLFLASGLAASSASAAQQRLQTRPERSQYQETSRYDDVIAFLDALPRVRWIHRATMGYTNEARALPLVVVGRVANASPEAVKASGRTRVYIQANIHAGEVEGKEAVLEILRDLAANRHPRWLDSLVLLIQPIYNADGNERVSLTSRPAQYGPVGGQGQRPNAQNLDLNRDHMKLESPEARSQARLLTLYDPHVAFDLHTTNGTIHAYHLTYAEPLHPATNRTIVDLLRNEWLPAVTRAIKASDGWDLFYYGNIPTGPQVDRGGGGQERGWYSFDYRPRFSNNYWGLRNRIGILSEAYSYATFEERIRATRRFVEESLDFAASRAGALRRLTETADGNVVVGDSLPVRARLRRGGQIEVLLGEVTQEPNPYTGRMMRVRQNVRRPEMMTDFSTFEATESVRAPSVYLFPDTMATLLERLHAHGIQTARLEAAATVMVERFRVDSTWTAAQEFQGHRERTVTGAWVAANETVPAGTVVVRVSQPLGRLIVMLLEPRSDDGFLNWNLFDPQVERTRAYPVARTSAPL